MKKILVGLSGGVDSAVTVYLLKKQGYHVTGLFLDMLEQNNDKEFKRVSILAKQLQIELIRKDIRKIFQKEIIDKFTNSYKTGLTPNPCIVCNPKIKFKYLLQIADELGIKEVATGHYAIISENSNKSKVLLEGRDKNKDQSYFLYRLAQKELERSNFPLGRMLKEEVKEIAKKISLKIPKVESQDVCFLKNFKNLEEFLQKQLNKKDFNKGAIVDGDGNIVGEHQGLLIYTLGQRKGLNIGGDGPFYVIGKDFEKNELLISNVKQDKELLNKEIVIDDVIWTDKEPSKDNIYQIKIRYQMKSVNANIRKHSNTQWIVECSEAIWAVASGQSLVVYNGNKVVGGGVITN
jgi:tRNA-specific 2-thiouridylase